MIEESIKILDIKEENYFYQAMNLLHLTEKLYDLQIKETQNFIKKISN